LPDGTSEIFLQAALDTPQLQDDLICPSGKAKTSLGPGRSLCDLNI
jgi:hypothetical protein